MSGIRHQTIVIGRTDSVKSVMAAVRKWKKACRNLPYIFTIVAPSIDTVATAVMSAGLLGDAKRWNIGNVYQSGNTTTGKPCRRMQTEISFIFSSGLDDDHEDAQRLIGGRAEYEDLEARVKDGSLPSCWYISNLNETRTRKRSLSAFRARAEKSLASNECMHLGAAGSATRVLFDMVADARMEGTHYIDEMTIHNGKRDDCSIEDKRDVTFVHVILRPNVGEDKSSSSEEEKTKDDEVDSASTSSSS